MSQQPSKFHILRVLRFGPKGPNDYEIAARLIKDRFARGDARTDMQTSGDKILDVDWKGITPMGEKYAAYLERELATTKPVQWLVKATVLIWPIATAVIAGLIVVWLS